MPPISVTDSEWKIMRLLWKESPLTLRQIEDELKPQTGWSKHAIISFLKRMLAKGAIRVEEREPARLYYPLLSEKQTMREETRSMLGKLYGGSVGLMISNMISNEELSGDEIDELLNILRKGKGGDDE